MDTIPPPSTSAVSFFPGIVTACFYETWDFYTAILGFRTLSEQNSRVQLVHPSGAQLGIMRHEVDGPHAELISAAEGRGFWFTLEVDDLDDELSRLLRGAVPVVSFPTENAEGERQWVIRDPNGILIALRQRSTAPVPCLDETRRA
jgi:catechol 2,3-dioxygenase-like lactoylglutathione lyase family enzyme